MCWARGHQFSVICHLCINGGFYHIIPTGSELIICVVLIWACYCMVYESYDFGWWRIRTCLVGPVMWASTFRTQLCESFSEWHLGANIIWCFFFFITSVLDSYPRFGLWVELVWSRYSFRPRWNYGILAATVGLVPSSSTCSFKCPLVRSHAVMSWLVDMRIYRVYFDWMI